MTILAEERLIFILVIISIIAFVYAVEKLTKRKVYNRLVILLLLVMVTWFYMDKVEVYYRNKIIKGEESLVQEAEYPEEPSGAYKFLYSIYSKFIPQDKQP